MDQEEITALFDRQAEHYDTQWARTAPIRHCLNLLLDSHFAALPLDARVLCVGAGTGAELSHLALVNPGWHFTVVEPSGRMIELCRQRAQAEGYAARCQFHEGYLESLPSDVMHHAATCFLVSQFILDTGARTGFFRQIAERLALGGLLASSDLAADVNSPEYSVLLQAWLRMMSAAQVSAEDIERMRKAYATDVAVVPVSTVESIIADAGFEQPVLFFQAGLIHGWMSKRATTAGA